MLKVAFVRGKYLNDFEGQNYIFDGNNIRLTGVSSEKSIHQTFPFAVIRLKSISDWENDKLRRIIKIISNRTLGDSQILFGLENLSSDFDIFHTADPHYYYSYQLAKLRSSNKISCLLTTSWETIPFNNETIIKKREMKRFVLQNSDQFLCYTIKAKNCLIKEGIENHKIHVIRIGVDLNRFKAQSVKRKIINILFVGRLVEEKGILDLYESFRNIQQSVNNISKKVNLIIIGDGRLKTKLINYINKDGLDKFVKIETKPYDEIPNVYNNADIFVLPSKTTKTWEEQYGMVLIEAMATGLPIIAYRSGAIPEIVENAGILIDEGNVSDLSNTLVQLIADCNLRLKLGKIGRIRVEKEFDSKKQAKKLKKLYENICSRINKK